MDKRFLTLFRQCGIRTIVTSKAFLAKARLEAAEKSGKRVRLIETQGAVRLHTKTVAEMAADHAAANHHEIELVC